MGPPASKFHPMNWPGGLGMVKTVVEMRWWRGGNMAYGCSS